MSNRQGFVITTLLAVMAGWLLPGQVIAHGALMEHLVTTGIVVHARYDNGQPMSTAQVTVFAPDNPARPWLTGSTNDEGRFSFIPEPGMAGTWSVQARQAGHGAMIHIVIDGNEVPPAIHQGTSTTNLLQRLVMAASVIWGCVGTALYYSRRRSC